MLTKNLNTSWKDHREDSDNFSELKVKEGEGMGAKFIGHTTQPHDSSATRFNEWHPRFAPNITQRVEGWQ